VTSAIFPFCDAIISETVDNATEITTVTTIVFDTERDLLAIAKFLVIHNFANLCPICIFLYIIS